MYGTAWNSVNASAAKSAVAAVGGAALGVAQVAALEAADSVGSLGAPIIPQIGTNGQLVDYITGGAALVLGGAGAFGKGPLKQHPVASTAVTAYGGTAVIGGVVSAVAGTSIGSKTGTVAAVIRGKAYFASRRGSGNSAMGSPQNAAPVIPPNANQRFSAAIA